MIFALRFKRLRTSQWEDGIGFGDIGDVKIIIDRNGEVPPPIWNFEPLVHELCVTWRKLDN